MQPVSKAQKGFATCIYGDMHLLDNMQLLLLRPCRS